MYNIYYYIVAGLKQCRKIMPSAPHPQRLFLFILKTTLERRVQAFYSQFTDEEMEAQGC